ncbi:hypothetical protein [Undibacterium terreum]|uniref:DUF4148 domain-containing protein n=1 Tax=Undibacterium terreum TaxID=1224302 RepID=A0A916UK36_9BURK|nr:hypothetical protein [Undibacterium terreum]GGC73836.1 hypothetical protein GCM10011396_21310 [Undibacterium terreum]
MKSAHLVSILVATLFAAPVFAQNTNTPNVDKRQEAQQGRIAQGINSGALTSKEATNLEKRETKIENDKQAAKADGTVTKAERAKLQHEENKTSRKIFAKKHNAKVAPAAS